VNTRLDPTRREAIREGALEALFGLPERIGRYEIHGELGRGGMGVVYDGFDPSLSRRVAIKVIDTQRLAETGLDDRELHQRFEREMRATSRLFHPNLVAILDAGVARIGDAAQAYYLMERIEGESLELRLRRAGPLPREAGLRIAAAIARGLAVVHEQGLVHRDLKPSNVLLPELGEPKLTDFGLSRWRPDPLDDGAEGAIVGSAHYLSPEQVTHAEVDARADLFSLGAMLVHVFTGAPPFAASSLSAHLGRIVWDEPDGLHRLDRDVRSLVSELLAKDPGDRPGSAAQVAERLEALAAAGVRQARWRRRARRAAAALAIVAGAATALALWAQRDLARLEAESQRLQSQLDAQLERSRALIPALQALADSADADGEERRALRDEVTGLLNRIAVERRRHDEAAARLSARLGALPWSLFGGLRPGRSAARAGLPPALPVGRPLADPDGRLDARQAAEVEEQLRLLKQELDVDARVLFVTPSDDASLEDLGAQIFEALDAGGVGPGPRGLLLLVDRAAGRSRIEVGYELEPHLFDAMAGALAREHLLTGDPDRLGLELRLVLRVVRLRLRSALLAGDFPPGPLGEGAPYGSGGAGGSASLADPPRSLPQPLDPGARAAYAAGASVRETYERYVRWLRHGGFDVSVGIFADDTRALLARWRATPVYLDLMWRSHATGPVRVVERGQVAMLHAQGDPLAPPHFFRRGDGGWQIDLAARERHVLAIAGGPYTWTLRRTEAQPLAAFLAELEPVEGLIRLREGDNRPLPIASAPRGTRFARLDR
jgi:tRNA A-37 threonylcarbamoyl transferase component Bud32